MRYSNLINIHAEDVILNNSCLSVTNMEEGICLVASGIGGPYDNVVVVSASMTEIEGKVYNTWAAADAYIRDNKNPSSNNRWGILITGVNNEDIVIRPYVTILGIKNVTVLTGSITSDVSYGAGFDATSSRVVNCIVNNVAINNVQFIQFVECGIKGGNPTGGGLQLYNGYLAGGDFSNLISMQLFRSMIVGGVLYNNVDCRDCDFFDGYTVQGGNIKGCYISSDGNGVFNLTHTLRLLDCYIKTDISSSNYACLFKNCSFDNMPTLKVDPGGSITFIDCTDGFFLAGETQNVSVVGNLYHNNLSGLPYTNSQSVLDFITEGHEIVEDISIDSNQLNLHWDKPVQKLVLNDDVKQINHYGLDVTAMNKIKLIIEVGSTVYSILWEGFYVKNGNPPTFQANHTYILMLYADRNNNKYVVEHGMDLLLI